MLLDQASVSRLGRTNYIREEKASFSTLLCASPKVRGKHVRVRGWGTSDGSFLDTEEYLYLAECSLCLFEMELQFCSDPVST